MPATSQAALKRKILGLDPPKDQVKRANGLRGAAIQRGRDPDKVVRSSNRARVKGLKSADVGKYIANVLTERASQQISVVGRAARYADEAIDTLARMMRAEGDCAEAPHAVRRLAALDLLAIARLHGPGATTASDADSELHEMPRSALMALLGDLQAQARQVVIEGEVVPAEPAPTP